MKHLLISLVLATACMPVMAENWMVEEVLSLPGGDKSYAGQLQVAYDNSRNEDLSWAYAIVDGTDVSYYILDDNLEVTKQFTIKGKLNSNTYVKAFDFYGVVSEDLIASKNVFTTDDKWCVTFVDSDSNKLFVYNEDSKLVGELPTGRRVDSGRIFSARVFDRGGAMYYMIDSDGAQKIYRFSGSSGVESIATGKAMNAYPNPVHRGENLTISLPQATVPNTTISVTDLNGKLVYNSMVSEGNETVTVPTGELPLGWLLYTVANSKGIITGKFCVE